ncbi:fimbria/pilus periplasmic chaperone [Providencia manganoxydans]|uniref:Molecular chaperone n=1 Tax=Providencia stuartii TaxID=588 RepID=A0A1S1HMX7_PROST|nr:MULTISPECIES: fimbria/pilus periplasmic chaperone [Providencia]OHT23709.1 molecular chaperone [Providencia stuartii]
MRFKQGLFGLLASTALFIPLLSHAGGIALGATRIIYLASAKQVSFSINNSDKNNLFLVQTWIENSEGKKTDDFIVTPPLFVSKPQSENTLRIIYSNGMLPNDRETLYWLNSKAIPSIDKNKIEGKNILQIAVLARIKLFVRPDALLEKSADPASILKFKRSGNTLHIHNPSPFYVTLINMTIGGEPLSIKNIMVAPKSSSEVSLLNRSAGLFTYQTINDYGGSTPVVSVEVN